MNKLLCLVMLPKEIHHLSRNHANDRVVRQGHRWRDRPAVESLLREDICKYTRVRKTKVFRRGMSTFILRLLLFFGREILLVPMDEKRIMLAVRNDQIGVFVHQMPENLVLDTISVVLVQWIVVYGSFESIELRQFVVGEVSIQLFGIDHTCRIEFISEASETSSAKAYAVTSLV